MKYLLPLILTVLVICAGFPAQQKLNSLGAQSSVKQVVSGESPEMGRSEMEMASLTSRMLPIMQLILILGIWVPVITKSQKIKHEEKPDTPI